MTSIGFSEKESAIKSITIKGSTISGIRKGLGLNTGSMGRDTILLHNEYKKCSVLREKVSLINRPFFGHDYLEKESIMEKEFMFIVDPISKSVPDFSFDASIYALESLCMGFSKGYFYCMYEGDAGQYHYLIPKGKRMAFGGNWIFIWDDPSISHKDVFKGFADVLNSDDEKLFSKHGIMSLF